MPSSLAVARNRPVGSKASPVTRPPRTRSPHLLAVLDAQQSHLPFVAAGGQHLAVRAKRQWPQPLGRDRLVPDLPAADLPERDRSILACAGEQTVRPGCRRSSGPSHRVGPSPTGSPGPASERGPGRALGHPRASCRGAPNSTASRRLCSIRSTDCTRIWTDWAASWRARAISACRSARVRWATASTSRSRAKLR